MIIPRGIRRTHFCLLCRTKHCEQPGAEHKITWREASLLECLGRGWSDKAIAAELGIMLGTVHVRLSRLYDKLPPMNNATSPRAGAMIWWLSKPHLHGIVRLDKPELL